MASAIETFFVKPTQSFFRVYFVQTMANGPLKIFQPATLSSLETTVYIQARNVGLKLGHETMADSPSS
jgi:hypothetical protein